jgi:hypothetical protein
MELPFIDCIDPKLDIPPFGSRAAAAVLKEGARCAGVKREASNGSTEGGGLAGNEAGAPHFAILEFCGDC